MVVFFFFFGVTLKLDSVNIFVLLVVLFQFFSPQKKKVGFFFLVFFNRKKNWESYLSPSRVTYFSRFTFKRSRTSHADRTHVIPPPLFLFRSCRKCFAWLKDADWHLQMSELFSSSESYFLLPLAESCAKTTRPCGIMVFVIFVDI